MQRDIQFDLAEFVSEQGFVGEMVLVVPQTLAQRLVSGARVINSDIHSAEDVRSMESTGWNELKVTYDLGDVADDEVIVRQDGIEFPLTLPFHLRSLD